MIPPGAHDEPGASAEDLPYEYLSAGANPFSSVYPAGTGPFPRLQPRAAGGDPDDCGAAEPEDLPGPEPGPEDLPGPEPAPAEHSWIPGSGPFDPGIPGTLPAQPWQSGVPEMEPFPDPNLLPGTGAPAWNGPASGSVRTPDLPLPPTGSADRPSRPAELGRPAELAQVLESDRFAGPVPTPAPPPTSASLTPEALLHGKHVPPVSGWRRSVYLATGGLVRVGESSASLRRRDLINRVRTPVAGGHHRVAVLSLKGGVGKTTTTAGLGATLASLRGDRVIAVDANPDRGTLSDKVRLETAATVRDLLNERAHVARYADVRAFTSQAPSRLEILGSDRDPGVTVAFSADDYRQVSRVLEHYYSICITDCGTGLLHSAMSGVLELTDHIVLVSSPSVDGARSASATLDWLDVHNCGDLVRDGVVVLSAIRHRSKSTVDIDRLERHFAARCRAVVRIPYDPHLEEGAEVELEQLAAETADAYLNLAATVGDGFAIPRRSIRLPRRRSTSGASPMVGRRLLTRVHYAATMTTGCLRRPG